jgi:hypothetical protein
MSGSSLDGNLSPIGVNHRFTVFVHLDIIPSSKTAVVPLKSVL